MLRLSMERTLLVVQGRKLLSFHFGVVILWKKVVSQSNYCCRSFSWGVPSSPKLIERLQQAIKRLYLSDFMPDRDKEVGQVNLL